MDAVRKIPKAIWNAKERFFLLCSLYGCVICVILFHSVFLIFNVLRFDL